MKNILLFMPYGSVGGMERLALTFYHYYKKQGYRVKALKIIKLPTDIIHFGEDELFLSDIDLGDMSAFQRILFYGKAPMRLRKILKRQQITHCISFGDMANTILALAPASSTYKIGSIHAVKSVEFVHKNPLNLLFKWGFKSYYRNLDKLVCISEAIKKDLVDNCGYQCKQNLQTIYNPHDFAALDSLSKEPLEDETELQLFNDPVIIFLGRLSLQKAPWHLLKAFKELQKLKPNTKLLFIGDGPDTITNELKRLIAKLGLEMQVIFLGRKSNPYPYLVRGKVLALTSYYEGTPNVIVEALSLGVPVVTSLCTEGIVEMMALNSFKLETEPVIVEGGIITPTFYKGTLEIPNSDALIPEEIQFTQALNQVLESDTYKISLQTHQKELLQKFEIAEVCRQYLTPIPASKIE